MKQDQVVIAVDVSASMPSPILDGIATKIKAIRQIKHQGAHVLWFDTEIIYHQKLRKNSKVETPRTSQNGTDAECVFRWIKDNNIGSSTVFIITDGYFPVNYKYTYDTIWFIIDEIGMRMFEPAFGNKERMF